MNMRRRKRELTRKMGSYSPTWVRIIRECFLPFREIQHEEGETLLQGEIGHIERFTVITT